MDRRILIALAVIAAVATALFIVVMLYKAPTYPETATEQLTMPRNVFQQPYINCIRTPPTNPTLPYSEPPSASYLLLSNWANVSMLVSTGFPIFGLKPSGLVEMPTSIRWLLIRGIGMVNFSTYINGLGAIKESYLTLNNTIVIVGSSGIIELVMPPYSHVVLIIQNTTKPINYVFTIIGNYALNVSGNMAHFYGKPNITIYSPYVEFKGVGIGRSIQVYGSLSGLGFIELSVNGGIMPLGNALRLNYLEVTQWLNKSTRPLSLSDCLLYEYYISLLLIKDDQSVAIGGFAASPEPIYLYAWVRDSSFAAMALQESGHLKSAEEYWLWMASVQNSSGTWFTRYSFFNGIPDMTYGIPEYDSLGLFQMGVWQYYELTHNVDFIKLILPALNKSLEWEYSMITSGQFHLIPEDLSIWEDVYGYNFWTQAIDLLGLLDSYKLLEALGYNATWILKAAAMLNNSIQRYFNYSNCYISVVEPSTAYYMGKTVITLAPGTRTYDSSTILPIALGLLRPGSATAIGDVDCVLGNLWDSKVGGLARFQYDTYHYVSYLYDSSGEDPPWIITTLFLALYYEDLGNYSATLTLLKWAYGHGEYGLLPEAIDPNYGNPLPTTSPLTWSAAMYVIVALHLGNSTQV